MNLSILRQMIITTGKMKPRNMHLVRLTTDCCKTAIVEASNGESGDYTLASKSIFNMTSLMMHYHKVLDGSNEQHQEELLMGLKSANALIKGGDIDVIQHHTVVQGCRLVAGLSNGIACWATFIRLYIHLKELDETQMVHHLADYVRELKDAS